MQKLIALRLALLAAFLLHPSSFILAQGPLTPPPGAPAPTMKTLDEVEARTPVDAVHTPGDAGSLFIITQPGSYYLTGNITETGGKNGVMISADHVTVDLNGFSVTGAGTDAYGILGGPSYSTIHRNISVRNGTVRGWSLGVELHAAVNSQFDALRLSDNTGFALAAGGGATLTNCVARGNGYGLSAGEGYLVKNCIVTLSGATGFAGNGGGVISHCVFDKNGVGTNAVAVDPGPNATVSDCVITGNANAIQITFASVLRHNLIRNNSEAGVFCGGQGNRIEDNTIEGNGWGLRFFAGGNVVAGNLVKDNFDNYDLVAGNQLHILLCKVPESIDWPAAVKLSGTLTGSSGQNGITVTSDDVTIDLDGHALLGVAGSLDGINLSGARKNLTVRNGTIRSWAGDGVDAATSSAGRFERLILTDNSGGKGLACGDRAAVSDCLARDNSSNGIAGGIICAIQRCLVAGNGGIGLVVSETGLIEHCTLNNNSGGGISVSSNSVVRENTLDFHTSNPAILATGMRNRIEANHLTRNQRGIRVTGTGNSIMRNSASGSTGPGPAPAPNYDIGASNDLGPVGPAATATSPWANLSF